MTLRSGRFVTTTAVAGALALAVVPAACERGPSAEQAAEPLHASHWSYDGETGPAHWAALNPEYAVCGTGQEQSPVMIPAAAEPAATELVVSYRPGVVRIENNGHTISVAPDSGSGIRVDDVRYALQQLHFHAQSEHGIADRHAPMEVHFVHRDSTGRLAVIGVLIRAGPENAAYAPLLANAPQNAAAPAALSNVPVDPSALLPANHTHWRYTGSLTTPPCSEGVTWLVMRDAITLSAAQIVSFTAFFPNNSRPVQPLGARTFSSPAVLR